MKSRSVLLFAIFAAAAVAGSPQGAEKSAERIYRLQWRDLDRVTRGHWISLALPSGIKLQGDVVAVETDELVLDVHKTSDKRAYPKGRAIVPRPEVTRCRVWQKRGVAWRIAGTAIGGGAGAALAVPLALYMHNEGGEGVVAAAALVAVPAGVGYLLGWSADHRVMDIVVEPER